ncbi:MAG: hypothetical protein ACT4OY_04655 [Alphaproteobacteria bacterium]
MFIEYYGEDKWSPSSLYEICDYADSELDYQLRMVKRKEGVSRVFSVVAGVLAFLSSRPGSEPVDQVIAVGSIALTWLGATVLYKSSLSSSKKVVVETERSRSSEELNEIHKNAMKEIKRPTMQSGLDPKFVRKMHYLTAEANSL